MSHVRNLQTAQLLVSWHFDSGFSSINVGFSQVGLDSWCCTLIASYFDSLMFSFDLVTADVHRLRETERRRQRETEAERDRQTDRQRQKDRQRDRDKEREK